MKKSMETVCQFLIGNVKLDLENSLDGTATMCQFLIGNVKHAVKRNGFQETETLINMCQFLIGNVKQLILSASLHIILSNFPYFNPFFPKKSVDLFF